MKPEFLASEGCEQEDPEVKLEIAKKTEDCVSILDKVNATIEAIKKEN
jgi:hypothetical protein